MKAVTPQKIAVLAVMTAVVTVFTLAVRVTIPGTPSGYVSLVDVGVFFAALAFGPWVGMVAGGLGAALADLIGFPQFAVLTLFAHGLQGWVTGYIAGRSTSVQRMIMAWLAGTLVMVGIYFLGEVAGVAGYTLINALAEVPANLVQAAIGGVLGIPLVDTVRRAYPQVATLGLGRTWTDL